MKNEKNSKQTEVSVNAQETAVVAEQPKTETPAPAVKEVKTSPRDRKYVLIAAPAITPKGKQRQIVLDILKEAKAPMSAAEVAKLAGPMGLRAAAGVEASCGWHLHQLTLLGIARVENPSTKIETVSTETVAA